MTRQIDLIILHCSATPATMDIGWKEIDEWHKAKKWKMGGYHYVIRRRGKRERGRPESMVGAHAEGYNAKSIGVCLVGGVRKEGIKLIAEDNFTPAQWLELRKLVVELHARYPKAKIIGHRDVNKSKECPSFSVRDWLNREDIIEAGIEWNSGAAPPKPISKSNTGRGLGVSSIATLGAVATDSAQQIQMVADYSETLRMVFVILMLAGVALTAYGFINSRKRDQ